MKSTMAFLTLFCWFAICTYASAFPHPLEDVDMPSSAVVFWHGMGDNGGSFGMRHLEKLVTDNVDNSYVHSLKIGNRTIGDITDGFFMPVNEQVDIACRNIAADPMLQNGYHAMGLSQGGQFLRAVAQRCPEPPMKNLVTLGAQHQGVYAVPNCNPNHRPLCDMARKQLSKIVYTDAAQGSVVQAQYWHDPLQEELYIEKSQFLAEINNDQPVKNPKYAENLAKLEHFVMVQFLKDTMAMPIATQHFGYYAPKADNMEGILAFNETDLYLDDRIGLKTLHEANKLVFLELPGNHLEFSEDWFVNDIVKVYFN